MFSGYVKTQSNTGRDEMIYKYQPACKLGADILSRSLGLRISIRMVLMEMSGLLPFSHRFPEKTK